jgi:hypothetical protein
MRVNMGSLHSLALGFSAFLGVSACSPLGTSGLAATKGVCAADGSNTYSLFQQWKKISPYSPSRTDTERVLNYDLLIIESGVKVGTTYSALCAGAILNGGFSSTLYKAQYTHDVKAKKLSITYNAGYDHTGTTDATYSFTGSCDKTRLRLSYTDGTSELYELHSSKVEDNACETEAAAEAPAGADQAE